MAADPQQAQVAEIGKNFMVFYYQCLDGGPRENIHTLYFPDATVTYENNQVKGHETIHQTFMNLSFKTIQHSTTTVDCHLLPPDGILICCTGQLKTDNDRPLPFNQTLVIKQNQTGNWLVANDIFRVGVHNFASS